jgi:hypothetical protein
MDLEAPKDLFSSSGATSFRLKKKLGVPNSGELEPAHGHPAPSGGVARPCAQCADAPAPTPLRASWGVVSDMPTLTHIEINEAGLLKPSRCPSTRCLFLFRRLVDRMRACTSIVEASNVSPCMGLRRSTRLTERLQKDVKPLACGCALIHLVESLLRPQSLRATPEMKAGVAVQVKANREMLA